MQATFTQCGLNKTSALDRWMISEDSPVFVGTKKLGTLSEISSDWTARIILANVIYFNAVNVLNDDAADRIIKATFTEGGDAGQHALAPIYAEIYAELEAGKVPSQIASRIMLYLFSINWTVAKPYGSYKPPVHEKLSRADTVLTLSQFDDGDYNLMVGIFSTSSETLSLISTEVGRLIVAGLADIDGMYFSDKNTLIKCTRIVQKYLKEKWGYSFTVSDET
ncbi:hypothetical protein [Tritonibacter mobilis]|uniref:Uncharacterized protein n=1 Tax=Tritonibacter mobilis F1926 TaxID=1265309 RepID=A0A1B1A0T8_9RHOB|nr:hypothetical protein [Tritonibacter mobilis]ANP40214.1 hypothetical protein K529_005485 [Tritonibacter mobilis F1926]KJZ25414.1 hypothetical protein TW79_07120 [Tritonibacter mobilis]